MPARLEHANLTVRDLDGIVRFLQTPFHDPDGNEWEFVEYLTADPAKRHDYELPDRFDSLI